MVGQSTTLECEPTAMTDNVHSLRVAVVGSWLVLWCVVRDRNYF
jgi:hypothetical protein